MTDETAPVLALKSAQFRRERERSWQDLEALLGRAEFRGVKALEPNELERLPLLYRSALSSLSVARAIALDRYLLLYLEHLALRAYLVVYGPRESLIKGVVRFLRRGFPDAVQGAGWHILISLLTIVAGAVAGFALTVGDEAWFSTFIPADMAGGRGPASTREDLMRDELFAPWPGVAKSFVAFASFLFQHNTTIGVLCFCLGIAGGVPTLLLLLYQGLIFGAFVALHYDRGLLWECLGWLSIHGITEFGAIILCAAAGLVLAEKSLFPGRYSRLESLSREGGRAARIAIGAMLLFLLAAILEGGFRQLVQSTGLRMAIGVAVGLCWMRYLAGGRKSETP